MRKFGAQVWRGFLAISRGLVAWIPALLLLLLGGLYIFDCLEVLAAPGTGFRFAYMSKTGPVVITSGSYAIDPFTLRIDATDIEVHDAKNELIGSAARIHVAKKGDSVDVDVRKANVTLIRRTDGSFSALDLLPPDDPNARPNPFHIAIDELDLQYEDLATANPVKQRIFLKDTEVSSDGPNYVVSSAVNLDDNFVSNLIIKVDPKENFAVDLKNAKGDVTKLRPLIEQFLPPDLKKQLDPWAASRFDIEGNIFLSGSPKALDVLRGAIIWDAAGLRNKDFFTGALSTGKATLYTKSATIVAEVSEPGRTATWDGAISWADQFAGQGKTVITLASGARAWPIVAKQLPKDIAINSPRFDGTVSFQGEKFSASGNATASNLAVGGEKISGIVANVVADSERVSVLVKQANWRGSGVDGWLTADYKKPFLTGIVGTSGDRLVKLEFPSEMGTVTLAAKSRALISGTPNKPEIVASLDGFGQINLEARTVLLGQLDGRMRWVDGVANIERAVISGPNGVVTASGTANTATQQLNVEIEAGGVNIAAWTDAVAGVGYGTARVVGNWNDPQVTGDLTLLNLTAGEIVLPKSTAQVRFTAGDLVLSNIDMTYGVGTIGGEATINISEGTVQGILSANDIFLADLAPGAPVVGRLNADRILINGALDQPEVSVSGGAEDVLVSGIPIDQIQYRAHGNVQRLIIDSIDAKIENGTLSATGAVDVDGTNGLLTVVGTDLPLSAIPLDQEFVDLTGKTSIRAAVSSDDNGKWKGDATVRVVGMLANGFEVGSGSFAISLADQIVTVEGGLSSLSGLFEIPGLTYSIDDQRINGEILATNIGISEIIRGVSRQIKLPDIQTERIVRDLNGLLTAEIGFAGTPEKWDVNVRKLTAAELTSLGRVLGEVSLAGIGNANHIELDNLRWRIPLETEKPEDEPRESLAFVSGSWTKGAEGEKDTIDARGRLVQFDPYILNLISEELPEIHAAVDADFAVAGPTDNLTGQASLSAEKLQMRNSDGKLVNIPVTFNTGAIDFVDNVLSTQGKLLYQGLESDFTANIPMSALAESPEGELQFDLNMAPRPLSSLQNYVQGLDFEKSVGEISAALSVRGQRGNFALLGSANLSGSKIAFQNASTELNDVIATLSTQGEDLKVVASANGSLGGLLAVDVGVDLRRFLQGNFSEAGLEEAILTGRIDIVDLVARETIKLANPDPAPGEPAFFAADSPTTGVISGTVNLSGSLAKPEISGEVVGDGINAFVPLAFPEGQESEPPSVEPIFRDFRLTIGKGSKLNVPTGNILLNGTAVLDGPLSSVTVRAPFTVESGTLLLPASRVTLNEGTVNVTAGIGSDPRAEVDLRGSTIVTVRQTSERYQTYRLNLQIRGNLLDPEGVRIDGTSEPPDLSLEEIRSIVGQRDFLESLVTSALGEGNRSGLRDSFFTLAIPNITQGIASEIAKTLQLDYLVLDYNPFDGPVVRAGREISRGLTIEASRQVYRQNPTQPLKFEFQLSYRPPLKDDFLSRFRVIAGFNERVPWKIGIEWSTRF